MLKILIVDDEKIIRHGIINSFNWTKLGIYKVLESRNGLEGLELYKKEHPDILLTDIRMPLMNGIELSNKVREMNKDTKIIFLTGYQEIEYVKTAFSNDAVDYLLKPVDMDDLHKALSKAIRLCTENENVRRIRLNLEQKLLQSAPFYLKMLMIDILETKFLDKEEMIEKLRFWEFPLPLNGSFVVFITAIDCYNENSAFDKQILSFGVENILIDKLKSTSNGYAFQTSEDYFVCILEYTFESDLEFMQALTDVKKALDNYLSQSTTIAVGTFIDDIFNIQESYQYARQMLTKKFYEGGNSIYYYDKWYEEKTEYFAIDKEKLDKLCAIVHSEDKSVLPRIAEDLISALTSNYHFTIQHLRSIFLLIAGEVISSVSGEGIQKEYIDIYSNFRNKVDLCDTIYEANVLLVNMLFEIKSFISKNYLNQNDLIVAEIKTFLNEHASESITINDISKKIFLTPPYICTIFKQQTGMTINEYVTLQRINKAKSLLLMGKYKLYEISLMIGYQDTKYFSKIFKRVTGKSPSKYVSG